MQAPSPPQADPQAQLQQQQAVDPAAVQQIRQLLLALMQPDTATIRAAEQQLKPVLKRPESMALLWAVLSETPDENNAGVRHVAAIVLRKRLPHHYGKFVPGLQLQWQNQVLTALAAETVRPVRTGLVGVAAAMAQVERVPTPSYLQFLQATANDTNSASHRELCFLLLTEMTETVGTHWKDRAPDLALLFASVLQNAQETASVHKAAVTALGALLQFWADEDPAVLQGLASLLPLLLQVAANHMTDTTTNTTTTNTTDTTSSADEDFLSNTLDVLYDLAYSNSEALVPHVPATLEFAVSILQQPQLELRVRDAAALVIATTAEAKPKTVGRHTALLGRILDVIFALMESSSSSTSAAGALFESNPAWRQDLEQGHGDHDHDDEDDEWDSPTETSMAQGTLDMLACEIPNKYIWQPALTRCLERMGSSSSSSSNNRNNAGADDRNFRARKAGVAGLGVIAEGCAEPLTAALANVLPYIFKAATDPQPQVRECACFCLGQISEHCQPDILQYSSQILPIVFGLLDDQSVAVQATSCYVLEMFCERLEPAAVRPVLDQLVRKLATMLESTNKRSVQEMAVAALAATAVAAEVEFTPYVQGVATLMMKLMTLRDPAQFSLRGRALECMGHMAIAVSRDTFRPFFTSTMQCAMEGLTMDSTDLQEFAYAVFANLAKVMMEEFAPALPDLVPFLIQVIDQDEGQLVEKAEENGSGGAGAGGAAAAFTGLDDSDDEGEEGNYVLHVRTAFVEVKKGAITALGEMAAHTGTSFCPHIEASMQSLQKAASNWHPLIKSEVAEALPSLIIPSIAAYHNGEIQWKKGDMQGPNPMSQHTATIVGAVLTEELSLMKNDDKHVVAKACEAIQTIIELCGPHALMPILNDVLTNTHELLIKMAPCQTTEALYGELPDDDDDHDAVMQAACDLVGAFGRVMGQHFAQYLPQFLPPIVEFAKSSRPSSDRGMSVGCLSEIAQELEGAIIDHWQGVFLPVTLAGLADTEDNVKRNAAFCAGICAEHLRERIAGDYPSLLQQIGPIFSLHVEHSDATAACIDNAAAAVARMIMACPTHVPMAQVLPVMLKALPLKTDMTENATVYKCLLGLLQMNHPDIRANAGEVQRIFTEACQEGSNVEGEIQNQLRAALQTWNAQ